MYRFLIFLIGLIVFIAPTHAYENIIYPNYPHHRIYRNYQRPAYYNNYANSYRNALSNLEQYAFNKNFGNESELKRLQRLELQTFGAIQQGNFDSRYENVKSAILARPKAHTNSSVWKSIGNYFTGQMTGFTPPIDFYPNQYSYNSYPSNYENSSVKEIVTPYGRRTIFNNFGTTSGAGVHILD